MAEGATAEASSITVGPLRGGATYDSTVVSGVTAGDSLDLPYLPVKDLAAMSYLKGFNG